MKKTTHTARHLTIFFVLVILISGSNSLTASFDRELRVLGGRYRLEQPVAMDISSTGDRIAIADLAGDRIYIIDLDGRLLWVAGENLRLGGPQAVSFIDDETVVYNPRSSRLLLKVGEQQPDDIDTLANLSGLIEDGAEIGQIARTGTGHYLVLDVGRGEIVRFDGNWSESERFVEHGSGRGKVLVPSGLALAAGNKVVVSDNKNYPAQVFSREGEFLFYVGRNTPGEEQGWEAAAVGVDIRETIWAADQTSRIFKRFDPAGMLIESVPYAPSLLKPVAMAGTMDNKIIVLDQSGVIVFYRIN